ncbi:MAG: UDP-glucose dehydrogenase family protein [Spirochaetaceae bacterium]
MSKIAVVGSGYVGLVTGACLSDFGHTIVCVDNDQGKIENLIQGKVPIYEPGLSPLIEQNVEAGRLSFTTEIDKAVKENEVIFIAVGTPPADDGSADLVYVEAVARSVARAMNGYKVVVDKSTVPIGTGQKVKGWIAEELARRGPEYTEMEYDVVSNPEFLREGSAIGDFTHPDRVVIGTESEKARKIMRTVYRVLYLNETPFMESNIETAEMIKYAANAFLAMKITFINEIANLCEGVGANVQDVARALGRDGRISPKFLHAGPGYGGSCFPKDTRALAEIGKAAGARLHLIEQTVESNERQKSVMVQKVLRQFGSVEGLTFGVLGLSFKPNTDDMRESPAITILTELAEKGARFLAYDPEAMEEAAWRLEGIKQSVAYVSGEYEALTGADAILLITEWNQFRNLDFERAKELMKSPVLFDFRNIYNRPFVENLGFTYIGVGV